MNTLYLFQIDILGNLIPVPCREYNMVTEGPLAGYVQLIGIQNVNETLMPGYKVENFTVLQKDIKCFSHLKKIESDREKEIRSYEKAIEEATALGTKAQLEDGDLENKNRAVPHHPKKQNNKKKRGKR